MTYRLPSWIQVATNAAGIAPSFGMPLEEIIEIRQIIEMYQIDLAS
jgi:hypothetical protein